MHKAVFIGIDIGSTSCKLQVLDTKCNSICVKSFMTPWENTPHGRQLDANDLYQKLLAQLDSLTQDSFILGIGITGFAESGVFIDNQGKILSPVLPWYDSHGADTIEHIKRHIGIHKFGWITGLPLNLKPSIMKFKWFMSTSAPPKTWHKWMNIPEWIAYKMTGEMATEPSLASRTGFFNVLEEKESEELLETIGAPKNLISPIRYAGENWGKTNDKFTRLNKAFVTVCGMDHLCAGVGVGAIKQYDLLDSCGTGEALIRRIPDDVVNRQFAIKAIEQEISVGRDLFPQQIQLATSLRSGIGMHRFLKMLGKTHDDIIALDKEALTLKTVPTSPIVDNIWLERATITNLGYEPTPAIIWRAAVESVQKQAASLAERMQQFAGPHTRIIATGGGLHSELVRKLKAERIGEYDIPNINEAASYGAALFAMMASGEMPSIRIT